MVLVCVLHAPPSRCPAPDPVLADPYADALEFVAKLLAGTLPSPDQPRHPLLVDQSPLLYKPARHRRRAVKRLLFRYSKSITHINWISLVPARSSTSSTPTQPRRIVPRSIPTFLRLFLGAQLGIERSPLDVTIGLHIMNHHDLVLPSWNFLDSFSDVSYLNMHCSKRSPKPFCFF